MHGGGPDLDRMTIGHPRHPARTLYVHVLPRFGLLATEHAVMASSRLDMRRW